MIKLPVYVLMLVTAYTASVDECGKADGITASGVPAKAGTTVASDDLPFGTKVIIDGNEYVVQDIFGGGYSNRLDVYFDDKEEAINHGVRYKFVKIVQEEELFSEFKKAWWYK